MISWRKAVHRLTGFNMHRHYTLHRAEVRIEMWTGADGETMEHAELYEFGELVDEVHFDEDKVVVKLREWTGMRN